MRSRPVGSLNTIEQFLPVATCTLTRPLLQYATLRGPHALLDSPITSLPDALTMRGVTHNGHEALTLLELVLRLEGDFRRSLEPIRVTPLQAGVILYLQRHMDAKLTDAAAAIGVRLPTLSVVVKDLVRKRWVTKRYSVEDRRAVRLSLSRKGKALVLKIEQRVCQAEDALTEQSRRALGMNLKGRRA